MFLGIDLGTSSVKALLLTRDGRVAGEASAAYPVLAPRPGWAESEPADWWRGTVGAVRRVVAGRAGEVEAIGLAGQMHGVVLVDEAGAPLRPAVLWADGRSSAELRSYGALPSSLRSRLGNQPASGMAGPSLLWLSANDPGAYRRARWALQPKDWLRLAMTGTVATEPSDASATLLYDLTADDWAEPVVTALGLRRELLPPVLGSAEPAGRLTAEAARELGLPMGLPVATGAADTAAAALGTGLVGSGEMQLTVGTGAQLVAPLEHPTIDPTGRTHLFRSATPGGYYAMAAMQNAGLALDWVLRCLGVDWDHAYREAFAAPAGANGVTFTPYLSGERTPHFDPGASASWSGIRLHHGRADLLRAAFEGVAFAVRQGLQVLRDLGHDPHQLRLAGGGSVDPAWRQLLADALALPLLAVDVPAASARGAALLGGIAVGAFEDVTATLAVGPRLSPVATPGPEVERLAEAYGRYLEVYPALHAPTRPR